MNVLSLLDLVCHLPDTTARKNDDSGTAFASLSKPGLTFPGGRVCGLGPLPTGRDIMPIAVSSPCTGNRLLDTLPKRELEHLRAASEVVSFPHGEVVHRQDGPLAHVYFPVNGVCSVVLVMNNGKSVEAATVGNEGMVGVQAYLGLDFASHFSIAQVPGNGLRVPTATFRKAVRQSGELDRIVRRYIAFRLRYANQTVACNALHTVEERACRWLLMTQDRSRKNEFLLTHEFLAEMLGVHRQTVSIVAGTLQRAGFIRYRRGLVRVLERQGLEDTACECYLATKELYERIMK
jgi:CRP-like cAMP-binding protein